MTVRGKILLFLAVAFGLVALLGASLFQGTSRGRIAREWAIRSNEQRNLYTQLRGDALLYLDALHQAHGAGLDTARVLLEQQRHLEAQLNQLRTMADEEEYWLNESRADERQQISRLEQALRHWLKQTEVRIRSLPLQAHAGYVPQEVSLDAYRLEVEPLLAAAIEDERSEVKELSEQGDRNLRIGQKMSIIIPLASLGLMLALAAAILIPMNRRFRELLAGAERIRRGELGQELLERGRDEFSTLARAFNQMNRELQATQARLIFADRMATLGRLAASVGHEINNPLTYVLSNVQYVHHELSRTQGAPSETERQDLLEALTEAREGAQRVRFIVQDLKTLSRAEDACMSPVDLAEVVRGAARMASHELSSRARFVEDFGQVPPVLGNAARLGQVFLNLLVNAAQAMPHGQAQAQEIRVVTGQKVPGHITVEVTDTGCGIPPENLERIFEPFFTTKPPGEGTGLGLSVCHHIITAHGGKLAVESKVGCGTTFRITLPVARPGT